MATKSGSGARTPRGRAPGKRELTRGRILAAAREVFAHRPYHAASMRMIGRAGRFDHALIRYHFPTKAALFETLLAAICDELLALHRASLEGLAGIPLEDALSRYLDRFLDGHFADISPLRIITLNIALAESPESLPGYRLIPDLLARTLAVFTDAMPVPVRPADAARYHYGFNNLLITFLGSSASQMAILGMKRSDARYRAWVKDTMTYLFLPPLRALVGEG